MIETGHASDILPLPGPESGFTITLNVTPGWAEIASYTGVQAPSVGYIYSGRRIDVAEPTARQARLARRVVIFILLEEMAFFRSHRGIRDSEI